VGSRVGLDEVEKRKIPSPCRDSNPGCPSRRLVCVLIVLLISNNNMAAALSLYINFDFVIVTNKPLELSA